MNHILLFMKSLSSFFISFLYLIIIFSCGENHEAPVLAKITEKKEEIKEIEIDSNELIIQQISQAYITNTNVSLRLKAFGDTNSETNLSIYTNKGKMVLRLYKNTPLHRANIVLLTKKKLFDNTLFYRVINNFMIQGGNSDNPLMRDKIDAIGRYRIPNEIQKSNIHKKGAIAMAVSPEEQSFGKKSSAINFYIIEGRKMEESYFKNKTNTGKTFTGKQQQAYMSVGGAPHLDGDYTVFGEVVSGMSVLNRISNVKVDDYNWPKKEVIIDSIRAY